MRSIGRQLALGLTASSLAGSFILALLVVQHYGLLGDNPPAPEEAKSEIAGHVIIPVSLFLVLFGVGAYIVIRRLKRQLMALSEDVLAATETRASYHAPSHSLPSEIRPFAEAINHLTKQLECHARRQEAFAADAAHELKTPLAALALELDKLSVEDATRLRKQVNTLSDMVDQLLLLARSNSPDLRDAQRPIDPVALGRAVVAELAPKAIRDNKSIHFAAQLPLEFLGLEDAVGAALRTLAINALRAVPAGGEVRIVAGPGASLSVFDTGNGLAADVLEQLKARGVRADCAPGGAAGLGLSIADRIVEAHGGELTTYSPARSGLQLIFPAAHS